MTAHYFNQILSCTSAQPKLDPNPNPSPNPLWGSRSARAVPRLRRVFRRRFPTNAQPAERQASTNQTKGVQSFFFFTPIMRKDAGAIHAVTHIL